MEKEVCMLRYGSLNLSFGSFELDTSYYLDTDGYPIALSPLWSESVPLLHCKEGHKPHPDIHELFPLSFRKTGSFQRLWMPLSWWRMTSSFCTPLEPVHIASV